MIINIFKGNVSKGIWNTEEIPNLCLISKSNKSFKDNRISFNKQFLDKKFKVIEIKEKDDLFIDIEKPTLIIIEGDILKRDLFFVGRLVQIVSQSKKNLHIVISVSEPETLKFDKYFKTINISD